MNIKHRPKSLRLSGLTDMCGKVSVYNYNIFTAMPNINLCESRLIGPLFSK